MPLASSASSASAPMPGTSGSTATLASCLGLAVVQRRRAIECAFARRPDVPGALKGWRPKLRTFAQRVGASSSPWKYRCTPGARPWPNATSAPLRFSQASLSGDAGRQHGAGEAPRGPAGRATGSSSPPRCRPGCRCHAGSAPLSQPCTSTASTTASRRCCQ